MDYLEKKKKKRIIAISVSVAIVVLVGAALIWWNGVNASMKYFRKSELGKFMFVPGIKETSIEIPKKYAFETIDECLLTDNNMVREIKVSNDLRALEIEKCYGLSSLIVDAKVRMVTITDCMKLQELELPSIEADGGISGVSLTKCTGLKRLKIGSGFTVVRVVNCATLPEMEIGDGLENLFLSGNLDLERVYLPDNLEKNVIVETNGNEVTFVVAKGSKTEEYVKDKGLTYEYK